MRGDEQGTQGVRMLSGIYLRSLSGATMGRDFTW